MSPTMILVLTTMVAYGCGHPLQLMTPHIPVESSNYLNKSSGNESSSTTNYTNVLHMNMSQTIKNKVDGFQVGGDSPLQTTVNNTDAVFSILKIRPPLLPGCPLPTCLTVNLVSSLQTGDETAGKSTTDPLGNGKK